MNFSNGQRKCMYFKFFSLLFLPLSLSLLLRERNGPHCHVFLLISLCSFIIFLFYQAFHLLFKNCLLQNTGTQVR